MLQFKVRSQRQQSPSLTDTCDNSTAWCRLCTSRGDMHRAVGRRAWQSEGSKIGAKNSSSLQPYLKFVHHKVGNVSFVESMQQRELDTEAKKQN